MKRAAIALAATLVLMLTASLVMAETMKNGLEDTKGKARPSSIEGTTWAGTDSDGDHYEYTFLPGGQLRFRTNTSGSYQTYEDKGDEWAQNGPIVIIVTTKYATRQGMIEGNRMQGDAWNIAGKRWTWMAQRQ